MVRGQECPLPDTKGSQSRGGPAVHLHFPLCPPGGKPGPGGGAWEQMAAAAHLAGGRQVGQVRQLPQRADDKKSHPSQVSPGSSRKHETPDGRGAPSLGILGPQGVLSHWVTLPGGLPSPAWLSVSPVTDQARCGQLGLN